VTRHPVESYLSILRAAASYREALATVQAAYPGVTGGALRAAFSRAGLKSPNEYVGQPTDDGLDIQVDWDECPDPQPDRYWVDKEPEPVREAISDDLDRTFWFPDVHCPYQDQRAWNLAMKCARAFIRPHRDRVVILGDFADLAQVSFHERNPALRMSLAEEIDAVNVLLDEVSSLRASRVDFLRGNHTHRMHRYIMQKAPELYGLRGTSVDELFRMRERGWHVTPYRKAVKIGRVFATHDCGDAGATAHMKARAKFEHNIVIGHTHRMGYQVQGNAAGESHIGAMFGWLGDISKIDYLHEVTAKQWQLGFGVGYMERETGVVHLQPVPIINYRCVVGGKLFCG
jgi:hypothetical protein